jgi:hypothetical protein
MDAQEFRKDFMESVKSEAAATGEGSCASFVSGFAQYLVDVEILTDFNPSFYIGTGKRNKRFRVDGYAFDEFDKAMTLIIADFDGTQENRVLTKSSSEQLLERLRYFIDQTLNGRLHRDIEMSTPCADLVEMIRSKKEIIRKYQLLIFTDAEMSTAIKTLEVFEIEGVPAEAQIWDIERLFKVCCSDFGRQIIEIDFRDYSQYGIPCLEASNAATEDFNSFLCIIPGQMLADIYDKYGSSLLEGNVRSFLSTKVAVNKKIRETILKCPERFFAYNNGISATAMSVQTEATPYGRFIVSARDFQIINGGQTTASLSNARYRDRAVLSSIYVQMKLTEIEQTLEDEATELVQNISRSSNSQNKVSDADFFSTHPFHVRMEQFSRRLYAKAVAGAQYETKWFYERARGQYLQAQMRMTPAKKKQFTLQNPKKQVITKTDLAKVRNTWRELPQIVSRGAQTNFTRFAELTDEEWAENDLVFNEKYFQETVALMLLFRHTELMVPRQPWYEQGYRANIVTYSIAVLHLLVRKQFKDMELDLMGIWSRQEVPDSVNAALEAIAEQVYLKITDSNRSVVNVTQWCKRDACWNSVQEISVQLSGDIEGALISKEQIKIAIKDAKADQRIISDAEYQTKVIALLPEQWKKTMDFVVQRRLITPDELTALKIACQLPNKLPTPTQSRKLLAVLSRAESEGFKL